MREGFARGVQWIVSKEYANKNNNNRYMLETLAEIKLNLDSYFNMSRAHLAPGFERERKTQTSMPTARLLFCLPRRLTGQAFTKEYSSLTALTGF